MSERRSNVAIVLAAGQGRRMGTKVQKQYLELEGKPVLYYSMKTFQESDCIDEIFLIVGEGQQEYCRREIIEKYQFDKVTKVIEGGKERYHSVWNGVREIEKDGYVFIHDGARPFVNEEIVNRVYEAVRVHKACVVGMPTKDTIKIADGEDFVSSTPDRKLVWTIQTPQVFDVAIAKKAYGMLMDHEIPNITDDAMVVEHMLNYPIKLVEGTYENIKITTPEDLEIAEVFVNGKR